MDNEYMIQASSLSASYDGVRLLEDVSFGFSPKGVHGILGPKGAGKSTLMDLLAGCAEADEGVVLLGERTVNTEQGETRGRIGYVPEHPSFYDKMTALEVLDFVGEARGVAADKRYRQIKEAMELTDLDGVQNRLTMRLTKTEKKRLALAAALLGSTDVLLLDEPSFFEKKSETVDLIRMLGKHKTVILASSELSLLRELCEDVVILSHGAIVAKDTFEGLEAALLRNRALKVVTKGDADAIVGAVGAMDGVIGCTVTSEKRTGEVSLRLEYRAERDVREALSGVLSELGVPVLSMNPESLSLEGVYASLVAIAGQTKGEPSSDPHGDAETGGRKEKRV